MKGATSEENTIKYTVFLKSLTLIQKYRLNFNDKILLIY